MRFAGTFVLTWFLVVVLLAIYEGSTPEGYRKLDSKATRIVAFAAAVAVFVAMIFAGYEW